MTLAPTRLQALRNALAVHPRVDSVEIEPIAGTLRLRARSESRSWDLRLLPERLTQWPEFYLLNEPLVGRLAHVNHSGIVCVTDKVGLSVDPNNPEAVVSAALSDALAQLDKSVAAERDGEFSALLDEFEGYWLSVPRCRTVDVHLPVDEHLRQVMAVLDNSRRCIAFTERRTEKHPLYAGLRRYQSLPRSTALYIPLTKASLPPAPSSPLSAETSREWLNAGVDATARAELDKWLKSWPRVTNAYLLMSQPRPAGGRALFGLEFNTKRSSKHPLLAESGNWTVRPLLGIRHTAEVLRPRGGASASLAVKHVVVVGCGAVGSRIAEQLALSGVGRLTLVDPEVLTPDNLFRHLLGGESCGVNKARALADSLVRRLPGIEVTAEAMTLEEWSRKPLANVDGIVIAIGVPHLERALVKDSRQLKDFKTPIVTTWLEALGLGGHAQLSKQGVAGCLECLYTDRDGTSDQVPKVSHVEAGQTLSRNLTGCVGSFTSFSVIDAMQTAILASRMMLSELNGEEGPSYIAWKGSDRDARVAGIRTTRWFQHLNDAAITMAGAEYSRVNCPVCGGST